MANIQIAGRLTKDGETRYTPQGHAVTSFSVAENVYHNGEQKAQFFNCQMWGERGTKLAQYLTKGAPITVFGELIVRQYTDKQGCERQSLDVNVQNIVLQGGAKDNGNSGSDNAPPPPTRQTQQARPVDNIDSDIPF